MGELILPVALILWFFVLPAVGLYGLGKIDDKELQRGLAVLAVLLGFIWGLEFFTSILGG